MEISPEDAKRLRAAIRTMQDILDKIEDRNPMAYGAGRGLDYFGADAYNSVILPGSASFAGQAVDVGKANWSDIIDDISTPNDD